MKVDEGLSSRKLTHWLLHRFWREPLVEPHEQHRIRHWYRRVAARAKGDAQRRVERASAFLAQGTAADGGVAEAPAAAAPPRPARFKLARAPEEADAPPAPDAAAAADDDVDDEEWAKVEDFIPTRWAWLRCEAQARADELEDYITEELLSADLLDVLKQVQELNPEKSDPQPQQRLIWRGGGGTLTEAVLKAVKASARHAFNDSTLFFSKRPVRLHTQMKACASEATLKADAEILVKGKLALDQTVLPPLLRIFAATCLPALTTALSDVAKQVEGAVVVASEEGSVKTAERMVEAMKSEIAKKHQAEEGAGLCVNQPVSRRTRI